MKKLIKNPQIIITMTYIFSFILIVASLLGSTNYAMRDYSISFHYSCLGLGLLFYIIGHVMCMVTDKMKEVLEQFLAIDIILAFLFSCLAVRGYNNLMEIGREKYLFSFGCIIVACVLGMAICSHKKDKKISIFDGISVFVKKIERHKTLFFLLFIISVIFVAQSGSEPRWDGAYVFHYLQDMWLATIFNMEGLQFCGHISMAFIGLNKVLHFIVGDLFWGMTVGTYLLLVGSVCCVYGILKELLPEKSDFEYTFLTAVYAFSPFIIGLSGYNYWDYWVITLFPIVIYTAMKKKWIFHFVVAIIFCFVKETAVVAYGAYCLGWVVRDYFQEKSIPYILKQKKYWGMLVVGVTWLYFYIALPNWDGVGAFLFEPAYIWKKLKVLFILNFNWILSICGVVVLIWLLRKKDKILVDIFPILISDIAFVLFSCFFKTVNHARYINTHIIWLDVLVIIGLGLISSKHCKYFCNTLVILLMIISNYKTIDPLTLLVFNQYDIGNDTMISTCSGEYLSDSMVYNQQYRYFDGALNLALEDAVYDNDGIQFFPIMMERSWFFEGIYINGDIDELEMQYWDTDRAKRVVAAKGNCIEFPIYNVTAESDIKHLLGGKNGYFYSIPFVGTEIMQMIERDMKVLEKEVFEYRGWEVTRLKFSAE